MPAILVVDDDRAVQEMLADLLREQGYEVHTCRDGKQALVEIERLKYDLVILDVLVPHLNGFMLIEKLRDNPDFKDLPVIMISGIYRSRNHRTEMTTRFKVIDYLDKPVPTGRLLNLIENSIGPATPGVASPERAKRSGEWVDSADIIGADNLSSSLEKEPAPRANVDGMKEMPALPAEEDIAALALPKKKSTSVKESAPPRGSKLAHAAAREEKQVVESEARELFNTSAFVMQGSLSKTPVIGVLGKLWHERASGGLLLRHGRIKKIIYLKHGNPYMIKSNLVSECLGRILVRERLISKQECEASTTRMRETGQRQGEILVQMGCLTPKNLEFALELQLETKLFSTFLWDSGEFRFNPSLKLPDAEEPFDWSGPSLVAEGIRRTFDEARLLRLMVPVIDVPLKLSGDPEDVILMRLNEREQKAIAAIDPGRTSREMLDDLPIDPPDALRLIYTLVALELLKPAM